MNYRQSSYKSFCYNYSGFVFTVDAVRKLDQFMVSQAVVSSSYQLMCNAAQQLLDFINQHYPQLQSLALFCGAGNNAGDGYVLARLAREQEISIRLFSVIDPGNLKGDALTAYQDWLGCDGEVLPVKQALDSPALLNNVDLIVDAIIGTGLDRDLAHDWAATVELINASRQPVLAVDIPSGLAANTGAELGVAVKARHTVTFIAQKQGMYTARARNFCGDIHYASLGVPETLYQQVDYSAVIANWSWLKKFLPHRSATAHKGDSGHLLIVGGNYGMAGACHLAGVAALRAGAGLVSIATRAENIAAINCGSPELMVHAADDAGDQLERLLGRATAIVIGPGLGQDEWSKRVLSQVLDTNRNKLLDADALSLLALQQDLPALNQAVFTPHPGEAARMLSTDTGAIEADRFTAIRQLQQRYGGCFVLKGAGTLVFDGNELSICPYGNAGMASGGMGDCLSGIIGALLARGMPVDGAAEVGVNLHAKAADLAAANGQAGMLASDLMPFIRQLVNTA